MPPGLVIPWAFFVAALWNCHHSSNAEVLELTGSTFDERVRKVSDRPWFVKFYAPWCGHCQRLAPLWEELDGKLRGDVSLAKVDATVEEGLASEWDVEGFPTLILIAGGKGHRYKGRRTLESMEAFARGGYAAQPEEVGQPPADAAPFGGQDVVSLTGDTFDGAIQSAGAVPCFVVFQLRSCGHCRSLEAAWSELATALKGQVVVASVDAQANRPLTEHWGVERFPTMKLVAGREVFDYEGDREVADMKAFALGAFRDSAEGKPLPSPLSAASTGGAPAATDRPEGAGQMHIVIAFVLGMLAAGLVMALLSWCTQATKNQPPDNVKEN
eukprot:TRINITY_DN91649_c0_g1_i1.p1 TRINITY_DN91649_c0_g1~~TRINITY_DN91649_c0_g1_i1.p1  ORF type:complete len:328 (+),score=55.65 TRINITY_DN91649_c0_g1_i1:33-1016(+)